MVLCSFRLKIRTVYSFICTSKEGIKLQEPGEHSFCEVETTKHLFSVPIVFLYTIHRGLTREPTQIRVERSTFPHYVLSSQCTIALIEPANAEVGEQEAQHLGSFGLVQIDREEESNAITKNNVRLKELVRRIHCDILELRHANPGFILYLRNRVMHGIFLLIDCTVLIVRRENNIRLHGDLDLLFLGLWTWFVCFYY